MRQLTIRKGLAASVVMLALLLAAQGGQLSFAAAVTSPIIHDFSPSQGAQGQTLALTINGLNFGKTPSVEFSPATGIAILNVTVSGSPGNLQTIQATIQIDSSAPVGGRGVRVRSGNQFGDAQTPFTVVGGQPAGAVSPPAIHDFSPSQGAQGQTLGLTINGLYFGAKPGVEFLPPTGITVLNVAVGGSPGNLQTINATIQIDPNAPLGPRRLLVRSGDLTGGAPTPFTVVPGERAPRAPQLTSLSPAQGEQGTSVSLTLGGSDLPSDATLQFTPSFGIHVVSSAVTSPTQIQAQIQIDSIATVGMRQVGIRSSKGNAISPTSFNVLPATPVLLRITPNQVHAGDKGVQLTLEGRNFAPGAQISFSGSDIFTPGVVTFINPTEVHVSIDVLPTALTGGRDVTIKNPSNASGTGKGMLNILPAGATAPKPPKPVIAGPLLPKLPPLQTVFVKGEVLLDHPNWGTNGQRGEIITDLGIPLLDDDLKFEWHEKNPGLADYFELRILARDGKTVLKTKRLEPALGALLGRTVKLPPTYYRPDAQFISELLQSMAEPQYRLLMPLRAGDNTKQAEKSSIPASDLRWQVAGFRIFNQDGTKTQDSSASDKTTPDKNTQTDLEVETSEIWPLNRPATPNGFQACPVDGRQSKLSMQNLDKGTSDTTANAVNHVGDRVLLSGSIDLSRSPYASHPKDTQNPKQSPDQLFSDVRDHQFDNLFIDWGDGRTEPLTLAAQKGTTGWSRKESISLPDPTACKPQTIKISLDSRLPKDVVLQNPYCQKHYYERAGNYSLKVFQLAENDAQHVNPDTLTAGSQGLQNSAYLNLLATSSNPTLVSAKATLTQGIAQHSTLALGSQPPPISPSDVAKRAYVLYCHELTIQEPKDPDAYGPLNLQSIDVTDFPGHEATAPSIRPAARNAVTTELSAPTARSSSAARPSAARAETSIAAARGQGTPYAVCSTCDKSLQAKAELKYFGEGDVEVIWRVGSQAIGAPETKHIPSSPPRAYDAASKSWPKDHPSGTFELESPVLNTDNVGNYSITVEARVLPKPAITHLGLAVNGALEKGGLADSTKTYLAGASSAASAGATPLKIGVLSPFKQGGALPPVIYADFGGGQNAGSASKTAVAVPIAGNLAVLLKQKPFYVESSARNYQVVASDPSKPCKFLFKTTDGDYAIYLKQGTLQKSGDGNYSGDGTITVNLNNSPSGHSAHVLPISFTNWSAPDGQTLQDGTQLALSPGEDLSATGVGVVGKLAKLEGVAGQTMQATLDLKLADNRLRVPGSEQTVAWSGLKSKLKSSGDWYKSDGVSLPDTLIGWSGFHITSPQIAIDLSDSEGNGPGGACAGSGTWRGVALGSAKVKLNTLDLVTVEVPVSDWVVKDHLCGHLVRNNVLNNMPVGSGTVSIGTVDVNAPGDGTFSATYDMDVLVPWLNTHLKGTATLLESKEKEGELDFKNLKSAAVERDFGPIHLHAQNFRFGTDQGGWRVIADTTWNFKAEGKAFTSSAVPVNNMHFNLSGRAYFDNDANPTADIPLSGTVMLGKTKADLVALHLNGPGSGDNRLDLAFATKIHLSDALPATDAQVNYGITGDHYTGVGPFTSPFTVNVAFPPGQPAISGSINPNYTGPGGSGELYPGSPISLDAALTGAQGFGDSLVPRAYLASPPFDPPLFDPPPSSQARYNGSVDLAQFGGPPVKGEFMLGYQGSTDYWLTRITIGLGEQGIPLAPPLPINLFAVRGGLGYHMALDSFKSQSSIADAPTDMGNDLMFMAGMRIGSTDKFTYVMDGDLTIATGAHAGARMDFHSWIMKTSQDGDGDFQGYFQYGSGNFDGELWGKLDLMSGIATIEAPKGAIKMHFGNGPWYIYFGRKSGPRIKGTVVFVSADSYVEIGQVEGVAVGGSEHLDLHVGGDFARAYIKGFIDMGLQVTPQPHVIGDFSAGCEAGACVSSVCISAGVSAALHAEALPLDVSGSASLSLPWPLPDITIHVHL